MQQRRSAYAQALLDAKAEGHYVPDVELVWFRENIGAGCLMRDAKLFAFESH